jgi:hypothetical protein
LDTLTFAQNFGDHIIAPRGFSQIPGAHVEVGGPLDASFDPIPTYCKCLRFYVGAVDPNDQSRFTIPYDADGVPGIIDGQVRETPDGPDVLLRVRSGPARSVP